MSCQSNPPPPLPSASGCMSGAGMLRVQSATEYYVVYKVLHKGPASQLLGAGALARPRHTAFCPGRSEAAGLRSSRGVGRSDAPVLPSTGAARGGAFLSDAGSFHYVVSLNTYPARVSAASSSARSQMLHPECRRLQLASSHHSLMLRLHGGGYTAALTTPPQRADDPVDDATRASGPLRTTEIRCEAAGGCTPVTGGSCAGPQPPPRYRV